MAGHYTPAVNKICNLDLQLQLKKKLCLRPLVVFEQIYDEWQEVEHVTVNNKEVMMYEEHMCMPG